MPDKIQYRDDLDLHPDFRHRAQATVRLKPTCHPLAALRVLYDRQNGCLCLCCAACGGVNHLIDVGIRPRASDRRPAEDAACAGR